MVALKKSLNYIAVLCFLFTSFAFIPTSEVVEGASPTSIYEVLPEGMDRLSPNITTVKVSGNNNISNYRAAISSLPATLKDNRTLIEPRWIIVEEESGSYLSTKRNLFSAKITGERVTVEYETHQAAWSPEVFIGGKQLVLDSGPTIVDDPINPAYKSNTIEWTYSIQLGNFLFPRKYTVVRYLRQIEGSAYEYYKLPYDPKGDFLVESNYRSEYGFVLDLAVSAFDSNGFAIPVSGQGGDKFVQASDLVGRDYPVFVDPQLVVTSSTHDGYLYNGGTGYSTGRTAATGTVASTYWLALIGQAYESPTYTICRTFLYFDTSGLPDAATLGSAVLVGIIASDLSDTDFDVILRSGAPTYPHEPLAVGDYNYLNYSGNGGYYYTGTNSNAVLIELNSVGLSWVNKTGTSKFALISSRDINGSTPTGIEMLSIYSADYGDINYAPTLLIDYSVPVVRPTIATYAVTNNSTTSAPLQGKLLDDGGAPCSLSFKYGTAGYTYQTPPIASYSTGDTFSYTIYGLNPGTLYNYCTLVATNSAGDSLADNETFLTLPRAPTGVTVTPDDQKNDLAWTIGTGSTHTMVRFSTSSYPTTPTGGTEAYFGVGDAYAHNGLVNGTTYYYSFWGYSAAGGYTFYSEASVQSSGTPYLDGPPIVTTGNATNVEATTATLNGRLDSLNGEAAADVWFQYYWGAGAWTDHETVAGELTAEQNYSKAIDTLPVSTLINFRIAATSLAGTTYGTGRSFTTGGPSAPDVLSQDATGVTRNSGTLHGEISNDGGEPVTAWFEWGVTPQLGSSTDTVVGMYSEDTLYSTLLGLEPSTTYYFRVVGENSEGISYGEVLDFTTTAPGSPLVDSMAARDVGATSATLNGLLINSGGVPCTVYFEYGTDPEVLAFTTGELEGYSSGDSFSYFITDLTVDELYYFQAVAENTTDTVYGALLEFTTVFGPPLNFTATPISSSSITLNWEMVGDQIGIFMKVGSFPVDRLDGEQVYFGEASSTSLGDLIEGKTYFFRAWSYMQDGTWSTEYSEAAATTGAGLAPEEIILPDMYGEWPTSGGDYYEDPSGAALASWPFYDIVEDVATKVGTPSGSFWLILACLLVVIGGVIAYMVSGSILVVLVFVPVLLVGAGFMGLIPFWIAIVFIVMAAALGYFTKFA